MRSAFKVLVVFGLIWAFGGGFHASPPGEPARDALDCPGPSSSEPRLVILTLDGVAFRTIAMARERGAFEGWPEAMPFISTFPSMTNVAFTAAFQAFGMGTISGYEMRHYDYSRNDVVGGGPIGYADLVYGWRDYYQVMDITSWEKKGEYLSPRKQIGKELEDLAKFVMDSDREVVIGHSGTTDVLSHFQGDEVITEVLEEVSAALEDLRRRHEAEKGRSLRFVLFSDHGNSIQDPRFKNGINDTLRDAGFRVRHSLEKPGDIVSTTYGVVSFGVLFTEDERREAAARAVVTHEAVNLAAWKSGDAELSVVGDDGEARIAWTGPRGRRRIAYRPIEGDPLFFKPILTALKQSGDLGDDGFASEDAWFNHSALAEYPDAPRRLIDSLDGAYVHNPAGLIMNFKLGYTWGTFSARSLAILNGGLAGTHGGLDRTSTHGFFLTDDPSYPRGIAVRADRALVHWSDLAACADRFDPESDENLSQATLRGLHGADNPFGEPQLDRDHAQTQPVN